MPQTRWPKDFAQRLAGVGVPMVPVGQSLRALTIGAPPRSSLPRHAAELIAGQFDAVTAVTAAAEGCDALVATGMMPAAAGTRSVAEKLGIRSVYATFQQLIRHRRTTRRWRIRSGRSHQR